MPTYSVELSWIPEEENPTQFHPTSPTGPFSTVLRGSWEKREDLFMWVENNLGATHAYTVCEYPTVSIDGRQLTIKSFDESVSCDVEAVVDALIDAGLVQDPCETDGPALDAWSALGDARWCASFRYNRCTPPTRF